MPAKFQPQIAKKSPRHPAVAIDMSIWLDSDKVVDLGMIKIGISRVLKTQIIS